MRFNNDMLSLFWKTIPQKIGCCVYKMHVEFSGSFPDYTIFICKFKIDECFLPWNVFRLQVVGI